MNFIYIILFLVPSFLFADNQTFNSVEDRIITLLSKSTGNKDIEDFLRGNFIHVNMKFPVHHSKREWKKILTSEQYKILRGKKTELAFSGILLAVQEEGTYYSVASRQAIFSSHHKYDSGLGWLAFSRPIDKDSLLYGMSQDSSGVRIEVFDSQSGSYLGKLFLDGPAPTGLHYSINSQALVFVPQGKKASQYLQINNPQ